MKNTLMVAPITNHAIWNSSPDKMVEGENFQVQVSIINVLIHGSVIQVQYITITVQYITVTVRSTYWQHDMQFDYQFALSTINNINLNLSL